MLSGSSYDLFKAARLGSDNNWSVNFSEDVWFYEGVIVVAFKNGLYLFKLVSISKLPPLCRDILVLI